MSIEQLIYSTLATSDKVTDGLVSLILTLFLLVFEHSRSRIARALQRLKVKVTVSIEIGQ